MRIGVFAALLLILAVAHPTSASAERRVALVIGNSAYQNVPKLPNPVNDARAIATLLKNAGFDVAPVQARKARLIDYQARQREYCAQSRYGRAAR
jgi:Caspase domain